MIFGKYINRYYLKYAGMLLLGIVALVFVDFFQLKVPEFYRMIINAVNTGYVELNGDLVRFDMNILLDNICLPLIVTILVMIVGRFAWRIAFFGTAIRVETDLRNIMFDHCRKLSQNYYQVNKVGNLMSLFTNDLDTIHECFGDGILMFTDALLLGLFAVYKMWNMNKSLTCLCLIPMAILLGISTIVGKEMMKRWETRQQAFSDLSDFSQESFSGIAVIKAFVKELRELTAFKKLNKENEKANVNFTKVSMLLHILVTLLVESVIGVILGYGGYLAYSKVFNAGQVVEFIGYFSATIWPIMAISQLIDMTSRGSASLKRISELLDAEIDVKDREDVKQVLSLDGKIEFKHLSFAYPDETINALNDVSFIINAGESVGIVGKTGSGKTTIVDLILRTYNVPDGTIYIDDHDINTLPIKTVREKCAYVPQDNFLFSDTIENNIAFAYDDLNSEDVVNAAKMADINDNILEFKEGYSTVLGERGVTVSGGQKQRISIARALIKKAAILILDDSVSAVDTKTERVILDNLKKIHSEQTIILIAHRISTVEKMDKIIFIDDGHIQAVGTHDELYASCDEYKKMVDLQRLEDEVGGDSNA
ncbi:MAG: ABC transporter ATP-binding protein [Clostridia bacterium]|nr:ABC transporter ATP-binding protein [Clostridia bacterium]